MEKKSNEYEVKEETFEFAKFEREASYEVDPKAEVDKKDNDRSENKC